MSEKFPDFRTIMGTMRSKNPYLDEFNIFRCDEYPGFPHRKKLIDKYAWAVPNDAAIRVLIEHSPIIEIGAGAGYWAWMITQADGDVLAFDKWLRPKPERMWFDVQTGDASVLAHYPERTLFLCWPEYGRPQAADCLKVYEGKWFIYVGEGCEGCNGDREFWSLLHKGWQQVQVIEIPQYYALHDTMVVYRRKETEE